MNHKRHNPGQQAWIIFSGAADMPWQRLLKPGFRHCFAALRDAAGWSVLDPLQGRLLVARLDVEPGFDLPGFYRRAGMLPLGPFIPGPARPGLLPRLLPMNCVGLCRSILGSAAPFALTPHGLYRALRNLRVRKNLFLTPDQVPGYLDPINGRVAPAARPAPLPAGAGFFASPLPRSERPMGSLFSAPKPVRIDPPPPPPQPAAPSAAAVESEARSENRLRARRGLAGTITTSARGVLATLPDTLPRRSLLGE